ncbi:flagellar motor stator protein MotA [Brevibacillus humidisoli]|uniref:flagellar motor stator protein MotA n=1 Tax=Brevibacillus humidisoli TaxID=2895522 RepID=UPI001E5A4797|nr:flagellar motor stator protein MotA [Brevibacillus humidisoli]UFJ41178.1 flagellar motor stator protein MotA [Brevibacillus humidisoli]
MEKSTYIGIVLGLLAVGVGMVLKGASLLNIFNGAAFMIIFVGTAASLFIGFPTSELKRFPTLLKIVFTEQKLIAKRKLIDEFMNWAAVARREGLLALENTSEEIEDPFLRNGMKMIIDGGEPEFVRDVLNEEISAIEERHAAGASIFTQAGTYAPTLGVLGAVIGLIAALGNLSDIDKLGHSIAAAFMATMFGIFSGYVLWHPMANKLKRKSKQEIEIKKIMVEGLLSIQAGVSPAAIEQKLLVYIPSSERTAKNEVNREEGVGVDG